MTELLRLSNINKHFLIGGKHKLAALNDISLSIYKGETLGVVGESGCGKSTLAKVSMGVFSQTSGDFHYRGEPVDFSKRKQRLKYANQVQMVFQDPSTSLNPRMPIDSIVCEGLQIQNALPKGDINKKTVELLEMVGLSPSVSNRFIHELSGGQQQRVAIARALATNPELLVCDEPISALDISIQNQIINLLSDLRKEKGLSYLFIAHDLKMVRYISDRVAVMYLGFVVELAPTHNLYENPQHPYTNVLMDAMLIPSPDVDLQQKQISSDDDLTSPILPIVGCPFGGRCPKCQDICLREIPTLREVSSNHFVRCHLLK